MKLNCGSNTPRGHKGQANLITKLAFLVGKKAPAGMSRGHILVFKSHIFGNFGLKWVAVAPFGLNICGNESHEVQDHF